MRLASAVSVVTSFPTDANKQCTADAKWRAESWSGLNFPYRADLQKDGSDKFAGASFVVSLDARVWEATTIRLAAGRGLGSTNDWTK